MKTVYNYRRDNMLALIEQVGEQAGLRAGRQRLFAERVDMATAHVSQLVRQHRNMGDEIARRIEHKLRLVEGAMDLPNLGLGDSQQAMPAGHYRFAMRVSGPCRTDEGGVQWAQEKLDPTYAFSPHWLAERGIALDDCRLIQVDTPAAMKTACWNTCKASAVIGPPCGSSRPAGPNSPNQHPPHQGYSTTCCPVIPTANPSSPGG